jgi:mRNA degradation ribonuclease J1/J2
MYSKNHLILVLEDLSISAITKSSSIKFGLAKKIVETSVENGKALDISNLKDVLSDKIQKFLFQKTGKKPIVTAVVIAL